MCAVASTTGVLTPWTLCSNVFGAALWGADILFNMAAVGVSHWDLHGGPGGWYAAVTYPPPYALDAPPTVHPVFYGAWLFSDAAANASQVMAASVESSNPLIVAWVTRANSSDSTVAGGSVAGSVWKVAVLHKDLNATQNASVSVSLPPSLWDGAPRLAAAFLRTLKAPGGPYATSGVSFGGQTFDGSPDGTLQGELVTTTVVPDAQGRFVFSIGPLSAVVLTIVA